MIGGEHLYVIQMARTGAIKVGRSSDPDRRLGEIQTGCPYECRLILVVQDAGHREQGLHSRLHRYRTAKHKGEWFTEPALGDLPDDIYDRIAPDVLDMVNGEWWRLAPEPGVGPA